ncbi:PR domain zinc finger protein 10-like [Paramacrobiotus metropolitanus]|uniref:PR domain zinc finger protein 10-like n=1 Tax=Paramacrobiotus metropolitanus TaxID=2943436 RepID=UPI0024458254|nr:PR domain zinc finger protein 10-like [Paramacrobiotus metropolitanus]
MLQNFLWKNRSPQDSMDMSVSYCCEPLEEIFCPQCQKRTSVPCFSHAKRILDTAVIAYSVASLPSVLYLDVPPDGRADKAVFAKDAIPPLAIFGPLIGALSKCKPADVAFACRSAMRKGLQYFDLQSDQTTNWMKFVRFAANSDEQNLAAYEVRDTSALLSSLDASSHTRTHVIFVATKTILPGDELKVAFSRAYAQAYSYSIPLPNSQKNHLPDCGTDACEQNDNESTVKKFVRGTRRDAAPSASTYALQNSADQKPKVLDVRARKRKKLSPCPSMALPSFLPRDEEVNTNLQNDLGDVGACAASGLPVEQEVDAIITDFLGAGNDDTEACTAVLELPLVPDDSCESSPTAVQENVAKLDVVKEMGSLKTRAHLASRKSGVCLVCGERARNLPDHLDKKHSEEDVLTVDDACFFCHRKFQNPLALASHLGHVHPAKGAVPDESTRAAALQFMRRTGLLNYRCADCNAFFTKKNLLDLHSFMHNPIPPHVEQERKCPECLFAARSFAHLVQHASQHMVSIKSRYPCVLCGVGLRGPPNVHMKRNHPEAMKMTMETWTFECPECRQKFAKTLDLSFHVYQKHRGWQCVYCGHRQSQGWKSFNQHLMKHAIDKSFPCLACEESFKQYHQLCNHIRDCHGAESVQYADMAPAKVDTATTTVSSATVDRAIEIIRATEVFACYCCECQENFASIELLDLHNIQHEQPKNLDDDPRRQCPACPFQGASFAELIQHTAQHELRKSEQRPCMFCGKTVKRGRMREHVSAKHPTEMQRITEDWEHQCSESPDCREKFKSRGKLKFHIKTKHKGFQCWYCAKVFYNSVQLSNHVMDHRVNGAYPCPACDKILPSYRKVTAHYRVSHDTTVKMCM